MVSEIIIAGGKCNSRGPANGDWLLLQYPLAGPKHPTSIASKRHIFLSFSEWDPLDIEQSETGPTG